MNEEEEQAAAQLPLEGAGQKLRLAREGQKLSLAQVAAETRIPMRHLEVIERGDFAALPARTYAIGFTRTYAKMLGLDDRALADEVRAELAVAHEENRDRRATFEPGDPAKVPSGGLVWFSILAAILLVAGIVSFYGSYFAPGAGLPSLLDDADEVASLAESDAADADAEADANAIPANGAIVFTSLEDGIWVRFYDGSGVRFQEKQMALDETFTVPEDATDPQIWTSRPDALAITIGGQPVPKLSQDVEIIRDVSISAETLLAREIVEGTDTPAASAGVAPAPNRSSSRAPIGVQSRSAQPVRAQSQPAPAPVTATVRSSAPTPTPTATPTATTTPTPTTSPAPAGTPRRPAPSGPASPAASSDPTPNNGDEQAEEGDSE